METPKTGQAKETPKPSEPVNIDPRKTVPEKAPPSVRILEQSIQEKIDRGNDPYNNTGEQILLRLLKDSQQ